MLFEMSYFWFSIVPVSEASIIVAVSSQHRREALEAVSYAIDAVKASAAIWKKVHNWFD